MEIYNQTKNIKVFGLQVKTFPLGIGEAFEALAKSITDGYNRSYYGISYFNEAGQIVYKAAAQETYEGEAKKYDYDQYLIEKGEYLMEPVKDWRKKTDCIKDIFHTMMEDSRAGDTSTCIEWYIDDDDMLCLIKTVK